LKLKLDSRTITGLALSKGQAELFAWDTEIEGFGLRLRRSGDGLRRTYVAQYRIGARRSRRVTLGTAEKLAPAQAREAAKKILAKVALGADPQAEKQAKRAASTHTFKVAADNYLATRASELRPASLRVTRLYLTASAYFKALHGMPLAEIKRSDVASCIQAINSRSPSTAGAARRALSAFFAWATASGLIGDGTNPVIGAFSPARQVARDRVLSDAELIAVWRACGEDDFGHIIRLLILLGARRTEIGGMRWSEIDIAAGSWTLPAARSKNRRPLTLTLPAAALAIITAIPHADSDLLFARSGAGFAAWAAAKAALDRRLGDAVAPWRLHDIRRTAATGMINVGIATDVVEAVLNHHSGHRAGVAGVYNRSSYEPQIKTALTRWSEHVIALVEGRAESNIVPLRADRRA
jgi:integrase